MDGFFLDERKLGMIYVKCLSEAKVFEIDFRELDRRVRDRAGHWDLHQLNEMQRFPEPKVLGRTKWGG